MDGERLPFCLAQTYLSVLLRHRVAQTFLGHPVAQPFLSVPSLSVSARYSEGNRGVLR